MSAISRPTTRSRSEISLSFFSFLFSELVASSIEGEHLEDRLQRIGSDIGVRTFALFHLRDRPYRRETRPSMCLQFIGSLVWKSLFGKIAQVIATDQPGEYYLIDRSMILNKYISISENEALENSMVNCAYFAAGIIQGMMHVAGFTTVKVEAVFTLAGNIQVIDEPANVTFIVTNVVS